MDNVVDILKKVGAVITDSHFVYTSGKHGSVYINKDAVSKVVKESVATGKTMREIILEKKLLSETELEKLLVLK